LIRRAADLGKTHARELATRALELLAGTAADSEKIEPLLELAEHHATLGDAAGELRALLRVLELDITHRDALLRVRFLYRASGDLMRAQSVTALLLELETEPQGRRERLLELAALARHMIGQSEGAPELVRAALGVLLEVGPIEWALARARAIADDCPAEVRGPIYHSIAATAEQILADPRLALELAALGARATPSYAPLLLMVERLSLTGSDPDTAIETYESLISDAIGPHGRRALWYRAGRWLERAGRPAEALERYLAAFELEPPLSTRGMPPARRPRHL
jgi:tetratricopeptide (TPR) repeat protein